MGIFLDLFNANNKSRAVTSLPTKSGWCEYWSFSNCEVIFGRILEEIELESSTAKDLWWKRRG